MAPLVRSIALAAALLAAACARSDLFRSIELRPGETGILAPYALPKGLIHVSVDRRVSDDGAEDLTLIFYTVLYVPDPEHQYVLRYRHSGLSRDSVFVQIDDLGLLRKISAESKDETGEVAKKIVELAAEAAKIATLRAGARDEKRRFHYEFAFDPTDPADCEAHKRRLLEEYGVTLDIASESLAILPDAPEMPRSRCSEGACFRPALPYQVKIDVADSESRLSRTIIVALPNEAPIVSIDLNRHAFVTAGTQVLFDHGMLASIDFQKPSEALGFVSVPVDMAKMIAAIPASVLDFKFTRIQKEANVAGESKRLIESQMQLLDAQSLLLKAQAQTGDASGRN